MTVSLDKLSEELAHTRYSLKDACYPLGISPETVVLEELTVQQCADCNVWSFPSEMVGEVCKFCADMDTLRF
jgi:hypothetical protein